MQEIIVAVIVTYAAWVVAKRYAPKKVRQFVRARSVGFATHIGWTWLARKFDVAESGASSCADGCGSCGACGTTETAPGVKQFSITPEALKRTLPR
jgi:hypothetical protein